MERWRIIINQNRFEVSDMGQVRERKTLRIITPTVSKGYYAVCLSGNRCMVHRLVAMAFCEGYRNDLVVNHINAIKIDNRAANLEWITQRGNNMHAVALGLKPSLAKKDRSRPYSIKSTSPLTEMTLRVLDSIVFIEYDEYIKIVPQPAKVA